VGELVVSKLERVVSSVVLGDDLVVGHEGSQAVSMVSSGLEGEAVLGRVELDCDMVMGWGE
jgi:hypothetical protein